MKLRFQWGSAVQLDVRLYKTTATGFKVVGAASFDVSDVLQNCSGIQIKQLPLGGVLVAELVLDRDIIHRSPKCARLRLSTLRLSNPEAQLSETRIKVSKMIDHKGLRVKSDRFGTSILEFNLEWNWPIRISVYDTRTGVELGSCYQHLHDLMTAKKVTITDSANKIIGDVELMNASVIEPQNTVVRPNDSPVRNNHGSVCVAIDFTRSNGAIEEPNFLHSIHPVVQKNAYQLALQKVAKLFSSKQTYTPWGLGANIEGKVRPIFQCGQLETVSGSDGLQMAYMSFLSTKPQFGDCPITKALDCAIHAAFNRQAPMLVVLLSDATSMDIAKLIQRCEAKPELRVILVTMRRQTFQQDSHVTGENVVLINVNSL
ncbi:Copine [Fragilaria crotonensis]|nr:Copine [Fragilaria crotonensis]